MKHIVCNFCGADDPEPINNGPDLYLRKHGNHSLVRCRQCDLIYQNPQLDLDELAAYYPEDNYELYNQDTEAGGSILRQADFTHGMRRRSRQIIARKPLPGRLLDIGCATGDFLAAMKAYGWAVTGVEPNPSIAEYARKKHELEIHTGTVETAKLGNQSFDVVTFWDVFEHVLDPRATLEKIQTVIKPGGLLVIATPNPTSLEAKMFGQYWAGWDRPRHTYIYSPAVLQAYLKEYGFGKVKVKSFSGRLRVTLLSIQYWCSARFQDPEDCIRRTMMAYNLPLRLLTWPIYRTAEYFNQTTNMCAFATYTR
jgi:ubiquinone/menaquinone biosynthesis C-methylase UbiE